MGKLSALIYIILSGLLSGMLTGMLSIGGGLVTVSLLMAAPVFAGVSLSIPEVAAMAATQSLVAMCTGSIVHWRRKTYLSQVVRTMGVPAFLGSLTGGFLSSHISNHSYTIVYAFLATVATVSLVLKIIVKKFSSGENGRVFSSSLFPKWVVTLSTIGAAFAIALLSGVVGITGGFILVPFMGLIYQSDIRKITGSAIIVQLLAASGNILARATAGPGFSPFVLCLITGAVAGGYLGARFSGVLSLPVLNWLSTTILSMIVLHAWYTVL